MAKKTKTKKIEKPKIEIGIGGTMYGYSDRYAVTVTSVISQSRLLVRKDEADLVSGSILSESQHYKYSIGHGEDIEIRKSKDGNWYTKGGSKRGQIVYLGERSHFRDPSF